MDLFMLGKTLRYWSGASSMASWVFLCFFLPFFRPGHADLSGTNPPQGSCLCLKEDGAVPRNSSCGTVLGWSGVGECYRAKGEEMACDLQNTTVSYIKIDYNTRDAWIPGTHLRTGTKRDCAVSVPTEEFRGLWLATVVNIDWPSVSNLSTSQQRSELLRYLDIMEDLKMNAVIFQLRPVGDALYKSSIEPWSRYLTGSQGRAPDPEWDPLQYCIEEGHKRGIEVHAWLNPYRASLSNNWEGLANNHMAVVYRQYAYPYGRYLWMDPGAKPVQDRLLDVTEDIMDRYDIDGFHMDDYFYPYKVSGVEFPDNHTYNDYVNGGGTLGKEDWRRDNVNKMVQRVYNLIHNKNRKVKFGISPFGLYRPRVEGGMPPPIRGYDQYTGLYADPKLWLQRGWVDYLTPQIYWEIKPPGQSYPVVLNWWLRNNPVGRHVYAGNAVYKIPGRNWPVSEIVDQITVSRQWQHRKSLGNIHFSAKYFRDNTSGVRDVFKRVYNNSVGIPVMPWKTDPGTSVATSCVHDAMIGYAVLILINII